MAQRRESGAERALRQAEEALERRTRDMDELIFRISHDLNAPLVSFQGFLDLMRRELAEGRTAEVADSIERLQSEVGRMSRLVAALLELSRIGRYFGDIERVEVSELVREVIDRFRSERDRVGARLEVSDRLPPVRTDREAMGRVFDVLLENAFLHGSAGPEPRIEIGAAQVGGETRYFVRDHGPGIAEADQEKVFGLFQRLGGKAEGVGAGLAIASRLLEAHGGRIGVDSRPGEGATFLFTIGTGPRQPD